MTARCACGQPVAFTVQRRFAWGVGPYEHVCAECAPDPSTTAFWRAFGASGEDAEKARAAA